MSLGLDLFQEIRLRLWCAQSGMNLLIVHLVLILCLQLPRFPMKPLFHPLIYLCALSTYILQGSFDRTGIVQDSILNGSLTLVVLHINEANNLGRRTGPGTCNTRTILGVS
jgi:hypothetical protein